MNLGRSIRRTASTAIAVALALAAVFADEPARWLIAADPPRSADAAVVLAGDPDYERTKTGARLLLAGAGASADPDRWRAGAGRQRHQPARRRDPCRRAARAHPHGAGLAQHARVDGGYPADRRAGGHPQPDRRDLALPPAPGGLGRPPDAEGHRDREPARRSSGWKPAGWWKTRWNRRIVFGEYAKLAYYVLRGWA